MLFHLVKKDCLLAKNYLLIMMLAPFGLPLFALWRTPEFIGLGFFVFMVMFMVMMLYQSAVLAETKYPKAVALLCATPYARSTLVQARYLFVLLIFLYSYAGYSLLAWIMPQIPHLSPLEAMGALFISTILWGIYVPLQYRLGYEKTKYGIYFAFVSIPFLLPALVNSNMDAPVEEWRALPLAAQYLTLAAATLVAAFLSIYISTKIYQKKELP